MNTVIAMDARVLGRRTHGDERQNRQVQKDHSAIEVPLSYRVGRQIEMLKCGMFLAISLDDSVTEIESASAALPWLFEGH